MMLLCLFFWAFSHDSWRHTVLKSNGCINMSGKTHAMIYYLSAPQLITLPDFHWLVYVLMDKPLYHLGGEKVGRINKMPSQFGLIFTNLWWRGTWWESILVQCVLDALSWGWHHWPPLLGCGPFNSFLLQKLLLSPGMSIVYQTLWFQTTTTSPSGLDSSRTFMASLYSLECQWSSNVWGRLISSPFTPITEPDHNRWISGWTFWSWYLSGTLNSENLDAGDDAVPGELYDLCSVNMMRMERKSKPTIIFKILTQIFNKTSQEL